MITSSLLFSLSPMELADSIVTPKYDLWTFLTHIPNGHMIAITLFFMKSYGVGQPLQLPEKFLTIL